MSELNDVAKKRVAEIGLEMVKRGLQMLTLEYDGSGDSQDDFVVSVQADNEEEFKVRDDGQSMHVHMDHW